eukprot:2343867-Rhodomonas_salina.1
MAHPGGTVVPTRRLALRGTTRSTGTLGRVRAVSLAVLCDARVEHGTTQSSINEASVILCFNVCVLAPELNPPSLLPLPVFHSSAV